MVVASVLTATTTNTLFTNPYPHSRGIQFKSHPSNTGIIYINGKAGDTTQGYPLAPGDEFFYPFESDKEVTDIYKIYHYSDTADQLLHYILFPN